VKPPARSDGHELLERAGYAVRLPEGVDQLCCGKMLASKGMAEEADAMAEVAIAALLKAADDGHGGHYPVIMDASTCSVRMQKVLAGRLKLLDFHEFAHDALLPRLRLSAKREPIALHINCSVRRVRHRRQAAQAADRLCRTRGRATPASPAAALAATAASSCPNSMRMPCARCMTRFLRVVARACPPTAPARSG
jgi:hypothetical protein